MSDDDELHTKVNCPYCNAMIPVPFEPGGVSKTIQHSRKGDYNTTCGNCDNTFGIYKN